MQYVVNGYAPKRVFEIFEELCAIPHGSGNESGVADYVESFARALGLEVIRDVVGNVFVRKGAGKGYEHRPSVLLQGHMDMVCEKNADVEHDFEKDGLKLFVEDGLLGAHGTSLGGDNGIAVAMMLAILEGDEHPALECLFTVEEETGLAGAKGFDCSLIRSKRMINLDSEEEDVVTAGCAGGIRTDFKFVCERKAIPEGKTAAKISVFGLAGGHSGGDIHTGRANAIVLLSRILSEARAQCDIVLCEIVGGGKDNAIAREASAIVACSDFSALRACVENESKRIKGELCELDGDFCATCVSVEADGMICPECSDRILAFMSLVKTGVLKYSNQISGLVEYSRNLGIAKTDGDGVCFTLSTRSSIEAQIDLSVRELNTLADVLGAECSHYARYPGWEYAPVSSLREEYLDVFERIIGVRPTVSVIHAGLECGIISSRTEGLDIISIGPNMYGIHSPAERLELASCEKIWRVIGAFLSSK